MRLVPLVARYVEGRLAEPAWRPVFYLRELYLRFGAWLSNRKKSDSALSGRFCPAPFRNFELHETGRAFLCCETWLPTTIGNLNGQEAEALWNSPQAQNIRRSILDGSFQYCNQELCASICDRTLPTREMARKDPVYRDIIDNNKVVLDRPAGSIVLTNDRSCNLTCPSCRISRINFTKGRGYELRKALQEKVEDAFFSVPTDREFTVRVTGSGDPFASRVFREFLYSLEGADFPNLRIILQTNGTLFNEKAWKQLRKIHANIAEVFISFDAATEETYAFTRRGGNWSHLLKNTEFLAELRRQGKIGSLNLDFVVQHANFREMPAYIEIGNRLGVDRISFSKLVNFGNRSPTEYAALCVWLPGHKEHREFQRVISSPVFDHPRVRLGNMAEERQWALECVGATRSGILSHAGDEMRKLT